MNYECNYGSVTSKRALPPPTPGHLSAGTDKMINARQLPGEVGWARLKLTEPLLYIKLLLLLGLTNKENARIGYTSSPVFLFCFVLFFFKLRASEFKIAQRGRHLSYARFACVCVHIADTSIPGVSWTCCRTSVFSTWGGGVLGLIDEYVPPVSQNPYPLQVYHI